MFVQGYIAAYTTFCLLHVWSIAVGPVCDARLFFAVFFVTFPFLISFLFSGSISMVLGSDLRDAGLGHLRGRPAKPIQTLP